LLKELLLIGVARLPTVGSATGVTVMGSRKEAIDG
jgi:hypothetical protein